MFGDVAARPQLGENRPYPLRLNGVGTPDRDWVELRFALEADEKPSGRRAQIDAGELADAGDVRALHVAIGERRETTKQMALRVGVARHGERFADLADDVTGRLGGDCLAKRVLGQQPGDDEASHR